MNNQQNNPEDLRPEDLWGDASRQLDQHFRRKKIIFRSAVALFLSASVLSAWFFLHKPSENSAGSENNAAGSSQLANETSDRISEKNNFSEKSFAKPESQENLIAHPDNYLKESSSVVSNKNISDGKNSSKAEAKNKAKATSSFKQFGDKGKSKNHLLISEKSSDGHNLPVKEKEKVDESVLSKTATESENAIDEKTSEDTESNSSSVTISSLPDYDIEKNIFLSMLPSLSFSLENSEMKLAEQQNKVDPVCFSQWSLSVYDIVNYNFKNISTSGNETYLDRRRSEEKSDLKNAFGMSVTRNMKHFSVSAGLEYSSYGEKVQYRPYIYENTPVTSGAWQTYLYNRLDTDTNYVSGIQFFLHKNVPTLDSNYVLTTDTYQVSKYNQSLANANGANTFSYIELPLELSYRMGVKRFGVGVSVGISPAYLVTGKGYYLSKDANGAEKISEIKSVRALMLNSRCSLDFYYMLNEELNIFVRPQFRNNLQSVFSSDYVVTQRYSSAGLMFGLNYSFH